MSTHAHVITERPSGGFSAAYIHHDGYIDGVGIELMRAFNSEEDAARLVEAGGWSTIGCSQPRGSFPAYPAEPYDDPDGPRLFGSLSDAACDAEYAYAWINGEWNYVVPGGYLAPLAPLVAQVGQPIAAAS